MLKKILSIFLAVIIFTVASSVNAFAQTNNPQNNQTIAKRETPVETNDLNSLLKSKTVSDELNFSGKNTLADYNKSKKQGSKFSTTTKVLIGAGIAAVVVGIIIFAAKRDVKSNIFR